MTRADDALALREQVTAIADAPARRLLDAYLKAWETVRADLTAAAIAAARHAEETGEALNPAAYRTARLTTSLAALDQQLRALVRQAGAETNGQAPRIVAAATAAQQKLAALDGADFDLPNARALAAIVGRTTERITRGYATLPAEVADHLRTSLLRGVSGGLGADEVAARITANARDGLGLGLTRSMTIARTELLDASRYASLAMYEANGVERWRWLASLTPRTCPACFSLHNTLHADEFMAAHPGCRCSPVPEIDGADDLGDPRQVFDAMPRRDQLAVMGPARLAWLDDGGPWEDLAVLVRNPGWRPSYVVRPVAALAA